MAANASAQVRRVVVAVTVRMGLVPPLRSENGNMQAMSILPTTVAVLMNSVRKVQIAFSVTLFEKWMKLTTP